MTADADRRPDDTPVTSADDQARASNDDAQEIWRRQQQILGRVALGGVRQDVLSDIVKLAEEQTGDGMLASILLLSEDGRTLHLGGAPTLPDAYNEAIEGMEIGVGEGSCGTAAQSGQAVFVDDIANDPLWKDFRELALSHGLAACWSVPIKAGDGSVLGTFANYYREPRKPSRLDREIIEAIALTTSIAVERMRLERMHERAEEAKSLVLEELQHRVKNAFALAQSLISLNVPAAVSARDLADMVNGKLRAIASAQDLIIVRKPDGRSDEMTSLRKLLATILGPLGYGDKEERIVLRGEDEEVAAETLSGLAMIFHELATNATKYGALTEPDGKVVIEWDKRPDGMQIVWTESGGPQADSPETSSFGTRLVTATVRQLGATMDHDWLERGLVATITLPAPGPRVGSRAS
ncbi:sensor histidine kinase [Aurantiacibacter rhizosphaerae]|uniref:histidine kinase n=1 Tax=Aurantiacibacter rhizosphaerae TaxID=2691582 RepID=A0A844XGR4_9SPHN|nr:GAF domain-containing protein [Aurantiacibacter rhizosphaerae]MWV29216.1 GAF domain-containing protein [Aurantiacibacter rhizosphaerae]